MESKYTKLALYGSKNESARTDNVFSSISEVCDGLVSLMVIVLLSASVERFSVSCMRDFYNGHLELKYFTRIFSILYLL